MFVLFWFSFSCLQQKYEQILVLHYKKYNLKNPVFPVSVSYTHTQSLIHSFWVTQVGLKLQYCLWSAGSTDTTHHAGL